MLGYFPNESWRLGLLLGLLSLLVLGGYVVERRRPTPLLRSLAWTVLLVGCIKVDKLFLSEPAGLHMLALITFALLAMKVIVVVEARAAGMGPLPLLSWLAFSAAWPGMQPRLFEGREPANRHGSASLIRRGLVRLGLGLLLVVLARVAWDITASRMLATLLVLPGLSLTLHFGLFNVVAGLWRRRGVACEPLFRAPHQARTLAEFWSRRWNLAFSEMTAIAVYRPLAYRLGRGPALMTAFAFSGVLHELAISFPVRQGFGLPMFYFVLHGLLVDLERRSTWALRLQGRAWVAFWVLAPLPLLFHEPFLAGIVWPLLGIDPAR